ncbi:nuclear transport factor 2 family protein [Nocardioides marmorisolisilvae]|uniref:Nuclear transport factor 2 family protein n=1 Tax=Nocardioides marmorisolisilvae TaxID=1542737 RepID=A0A3N0DIE2_9ACTN|nr:nuclear transport factor 2 family protein [Nocardioides marmorisolisilvae]RNL75429.1 nuclear transport factor 2 family protein [Nocardioides marmorisolisilvae]
MTSPDDAVRWLATDEPHPARQAQRNALATACAGDKEGWLALWAEDCEIFDPVGPSIFDAEGHGHHGLAGIEHFWDVAIAPVEQFEVEIHSSFACGDSSAQEGTFRTWFADGSGAEIDLVTVYRVDADGLITSMRAYWELDKVRTTTRV